MFYDDDYDDYEYEDADDYYDYDDDDEYYDDDEEIGSGGSSPFSGLPARNSPGSSGSSGRLTSSSLSGGGRTSGSSSSFRSSGLTGGNNFRSSGDMRSSLLSGRGGDDDDKDDLRNRLNSSSRQGGSGLPGSGNRFGSSGLSSNRPSSSASDKKSGSSLSSSRTGMRSSGLSDNASSKKQPLSPPEDKKDGDKKPGGSLLNRFGGGKASSTDKKDTDKSSSSGGLGGLRNRFGSGSSDDKKSTSAKKDSSPSGGLGGLRNRFGSGSSDDKKSTSAKKDSGSSGGLRGRSGGNSGNNDKKSGSSAATGRTAGIGGLFNRGGSKDSDKKSDDTKSSGLPFRRPGASTAKDDKSTTSTNKKGSNAAAASSGGRFGALGGIGARFRGGSGDESGDDKKATTKASTGKKASPLAQSRQTGTAGNKKSGNSTRGSKAAASTNTAASSGMFSRIGGLLGRNNDSATSSSTRSRSSSRTQTSKVPAPVEGEGLTLDNWLDILGVALVFGSIVIIVSSLSSEQAAIGAYHNAAGQLLGWGAAAVPLFMFAIGMWLIVRHFGDDAPTIDPVRVAGVVLGYITILALFQYVDTFSPRYATITSLSDLRVNLDIAWQHWKTGGGLVGSEIYYFLVQNFSEVGGVFVLFFSSIVSLMLIFRVTMSEIVVFVGGLGLTVRDNMRQRAATRRTRRQLAAQEAQQLAELQAQSVTPGEDAGIPAEAVPAVAAAAPPSGRGIRFNRGTQKPPSVPEAPMTTPQLVPVTAGANGQSNNKGGGLLSGFRRNNNGRNNTKPPSTLPLPETPLPMDDAPLSAPAASNGNGQGFPVFGGNAAAILPPNELPVPAIGTDREEAAASIGTLIGAAGAAAVAMNGSDNDKDETVAQPDDIHQARQSRLNELRSGKTSPIQTQAAAPEQGEKSDYNPFGKPDDLMTHASEKLPYQELGTTKATSAVSQLPSVQPAGQNGLQQQSLRIEPEPQRQQPVSSQVKNQTRPKPQWRIPDYRTLLSSGGEQEFDRELLLRQANIIEETLESFGAPGRVVEVNTGPVITQFGVEPDYLTGRSGKKQRVKVSAIASLDKDMQLALGARSIRVEAPVPGKGYVGIEVPNAESSLVSLRDVMDSAPFQKYDSPLAIALGQSVSGAPISADLAAMPHCLIAGATGSGKSVCVNAIITSILAKNTPEVVRFIMVDPKRVELTGYNGIPHLLSPVVVDVERILGVLKWVTREMDDRYKKFSQAGARNITDYNKHRDAATDNMPYIVVIVDELADLMMIAPEETERIIARIAALARATGIHLVIATQRPSVDVVTGLIKANFPARIAFAVASGVDSRVILDQPGAERLLGRGDMLYMSGNSPAPARLQGVFVSDMEINNINRYWKMQAFNQPDALGDQVSFRNTTQEPVREVAARGERVKQQTFWDSNAANLPSQMPSESNLSENAITGDTDDEDELYEQAVELVRRLDKASISLLQRRLRIGYTRAARLIDVMEARNVVGPAKEGSSKPRDVIPTN